MKSDAKIVAEFLAELPEERRSALKAVRAVVLENLPGGYEECVRRGRITYKAPLKIYPDTYNTLLNIAAHEQTVTFIVTCADTPAEL